MRIEKLLKPIKIKHERFMKIFLYCCFILTVLLSMIILLSFFNICYLPINTTGECVIARSVLSFKFFIPFLLIESVFSIGVSALYLLDGFRYKIKIYKVLGIANLVFQPFVILFIIKIFG